MKTKCLRCGMEFVIDHPQRRNAEFTYCAELNCERRMWAVLKGAGAHRRAQMGMTPDDYRDWGVL